LLPESSFTSRHNPLDDPSTWVLLLLGGRASARAGLQPRCVSEIAQSLKMTQDKDPGLAIDYAGEPEGDRAFETGVVFERAKLCRCMVPLQDPDEAR
jgi:hypothetical protein